MAWVGYGGDDVEFRFVGLGDPILGVPYAHLDLFLDAAATVPAASPADVRAVGGATLTLPMAATAGSQWPSFEARADAALWYRVNGGPVNRLWPTVEARLAAQRVALAGAPDVLISGAVTRDSNGTATAASLVWPDGATGAYVADTVSSAFPGAVDAYHVTHVLAGTTTTYTQPAVTRDASGAVTNRPVMVVT